MNNDADITRQSHIRYKNIIFQNDQRRSYYEKALRYNRSMGITHAHQKYSEERISEVGKYYQCDPSRRTTLREMELCYFDALLMWMLDEQHSTNNERREHEFNILSGISSKTTLLLQDSLERSQ